MSKFDKVLDLARALYDPNFSLRTQHFSFIFLKSRLISIGRNSPKTNPINLFNPRRGKDGFLINNKGTCSELSACIKLKNITNIDSRKCELYNVRIDRKNQIALSAPCPSCASLLDYFKFKSVFYTGNDGYFKLYV